MEKLWRCPKRVAPAAVAGSSAPRQPTGPTSERQLGSSRVRCTALGLGGVCWEEDDALWMNNVHAAMRRGVQYYDTAPAYGTGLSEHRMGMALRPYPRDSFVLSTKVGYYLRPDATPTPTAAIASAGAAAMPFLMDFNYSYDAVMRQFEDSLQRLGCARVDCLVIHGLDYSSETYEGIEANLQILATGGLVALHELRASGQIGAIGLGVNEECPVVRTHNGGTAGEAAAFNYRFVKRVIGMMVNHQDAGTDAHASSAAAVDFLLLAGIHTLLNHTAWESGILDLCAEHGVGVVMGAPFNSGILTSAMADADFAGASFSYKPALTPTIERAREIAAVCATHGVSLTAAALQFPLGSAVVATVIPGAKDVAELQSNADAMSEPIPPAFWAELKDTGLLPRAIPTPCY